MWRESISLNCLKQAEPQKRKVDSWLPGLGVGEKTRVADECGGVSFCQSAFFCYAKNIQENKFIRERDLLWLSASEVSGHSPLLVLFLGLLEREASWQEHVAERSRSPPGGQEKARVPVSSASTCPLTDLLRAPWAGTSLQCMSRPYKMIKEKTASQKNYAESNSTQ